MQLVEQDSATILGQDNAALDATHSMTNKFDGPGDANFGLVGGTIKKMVGVALDIALSQREGTCLPIIAPTWSRHQTVAYNPPPQRIFHDQSKTESSFHWPREGADETQGSVVPFTFKFNPRRSAENIRYTRNGRLWEKRGCSEICT